MRFTTFDTAASGYKANCRGIPIRVHVPPLNKFVCHCTCLLDDLLVCLLVRGLCLCVYRGASVCNAAANSL